MALVSLQRDCRHFYFWMLKFENINFCKLAKGVYTDPLLLFPSLLFQAQSFVFASPLTGFGEIGSGYPTNVFDGNRLSLLILRQKMALYDV
jgi:hypothetical protein